MIFFYYIGWPFAKIVDWLCEVEKDEDFRIISILCGIFISFGIIVTLVGWFKNV